MQNNMLNDVLSSDVSHESYANHESRTIGPDSSTQATLGIQGQPMSVSDKFAFPLLTKRELFAALVMAGCSANAYDSEHMLTQDEAATSAVIWADALIRALAK